MASRRTRTGTSPSTVTTHSPPRNTISNSSNGSTLSSRIRESIRMGRESLLLHDYGFPPLAIKAKPIPFDQQVQKCRSAPNKDGLGVTSGRNSEMSSGEMNMVDLDFSSLSAHSRLSRHSNTLQNGTGDADQGGFFSWFLPRSNDSESSTNSDPVGEFIQDRLDTFFSNLDFLMNGSRLHEEDDAHYYECGKAMAGHRTMDHMSEESAELERQTKLYND